LNYESGLTLVAVADFNGNGTPDLVWENLSTGAVQLDYYTFTGAAPVSQKICVVARRGRVAGNRAARSDRCAYP
jgi:hypothetical protein